MALIPPNYLNSVVSIRVDSGQEKQTIATGFLLGTPRGEKNKDGKDLFNLSLITNRHVFEDIKTGKKLEKVYLRFNAADLTLPITLVMIFLKTC
jgi:hypothetical protein